MKNISFLLVFMLFLIVGAVKAHALLIQGPNVLYTSHPSFFIKFVNIFSQESTPIKVNKNSNLKKVIRKQKYAEDLPPVGATIFIESYPVEFLKK